MKEHRAEAMGFGIFFFYLPHKTQNPYSVHLPPWTGEHWQMDICHMRDYEFFGAAISLVFSDVARDFPSSTFLIHQTKRVTVKEL